MKLEFKNSYNNQKGYKYRYWKVFPAISVEYQDNTRQKHFSIIFGWLLWYVEWSFTI